MAKPKTYDAVEQVKSLARVFHSVIDLAEVLGEVASVEQATGEAKVFLVRAQAEVAAERERLADLKMQSALTIEHAEQRARNLSAKADACVANAEAAALALREATTKTCDAEIGKAREATAAASHAVAELTAQAQHKSRELADIEAKINRAKAKMAELLGA